MDDVFAKLKQVTGVKTLEEMHEKFSNQKNNKRSLESEVTIKPHLLTHSLTHYLTSLTHLLFTNLHSLHSQTH